MQQHLGGRIIAILMVILCVLVVWVHSHKNNRKQRAECGISCPTGQKLVARADYVATSNGCGPSGEFNEISDKIGFTDCCHEHDICYTDCSKTKQTCDSEFTECLTGHCKTKKHEQEECSNTAGLFSFGVSLFGCEAYTNSLKEACECKVVLETNIDHSKQEL